MQIRQSWQNTQKNWASHPIGCRITLFCRSITKIRILVAAPTNRPLIIFAPEGKPIPDLPGEGYVLTAEDADRAGLPHGTWLEPGLRWPSEAEAKSQPGQNPLQ